MQLGRMLSAFIQHTGTCTLSQKFHIPKENNLQIDTTNV